jgi:hypothetical protein
VIAWAIQSIRLARRVGAGMLVHFEAVTERDRIEQHTRPFLSVSQAAVEIGVGRTLAYTMVADGRVAAGAARLPDCRP